MQKLPIKNLVNLESKTGNALNKFIDINSVFTTPEFILVANYVSFSSPIYQLLILTTQ